MSLTSTDLAVIVTTYNNPRWLEKVLWGYAAQTQGGFEIVIADDGSGDETRQLIDNARNDLKLRLNHVWHEDVGFRKTEILNKAICATDAPYLLFTDGDCVPRADFVETHLKHARAGRFLSGGYFKLPQPISETISRDDIMEGRFSSLAWLHANGLNKTHGEWKLRAQGRLAALLDALTPTKPTWNGANSSGWRRDILAVNGFDERMRYGGLDRELGERLDNYGVRGVQIRHRAVCLHLHHGRPYANRESWDENKAIRREVREKKLVWTPFGIEKTNSPTETVTPVRSTPERAV